MGKLNMANDNVPENFETLSHFHLGDDEEIPDYDEDDSDEDV